MKKILAILGTIITIAVCGLIVFTVISENTVDLTDTSDWHYVTHSDFEAKLPKALESSDNLYYTSTGSEQIACYSYEDMVFSVATLPMSSDLIEKLNLEKYISNLEINGEKLEPIELNGGYYYTRTRNSSADKTNDIFQVEALFKGKNKVYNVIVYCPMEDKAKYEESMQKWIESFTLR